MSTQLALSKERAAPAGWGRDGSTAGSRFQARGRQQVTLFSVRSSSLYLSGAKIGVVAQGGPRVAFGGSGPWMGKMLHSPFRSTLPESKHRPRGRSPPRPCTCDHVARRCYTVLRGTTAAAETVGPCRRAVPSLKPGVWMDHQLQTAPRLAATDPHAPPLPPAWPSLRHL